MSRSLVWGSELLIVDIVISGVHDDRCSHRNHPLNSGGVRPSTAFPYLNCVAFFSCIARKLPSLIFAWLVSK